MIKKPFHEYKVATGRRQFEMLGDYLTTLPTPTPSSEH